MVAGCNVRVADYEHVMREFEIECYDTGPYVIWEI